MEINSDFLVRLQAIKRLGFCSLILFQTFLLAGINGKLNWLVAFLPLLPFSYLVPAAIHMTMNSITPAIRECSKQVVLFGICYALLNGIVFFSLLGLKLENIINIGWGYIYIPIWYGIGICAIFIYFSLPGLLGKNIKKKRQVIMTII